MMREIKQLKIKQINQIFKDALKGNEYDFTQIRLGKAILLLSIPMVLEMMMESIFAIVDILFVSKLGADAVASVGLTESLMTLFYSIAGGLAVATTSIISRRVGEKDYDSANKAAYQAILTAVVFSFLFAIPGLIFPKEILALMGASKNVIDNYSGYLSIILSTNVVVMLLFVINAVLRGAGDAALTLRVLFIANLLNIILDPIFIFGFGPIPAMGVEGAAIATSFGRAVAIGFQLYILIKGKSRIKLSFDRLAPDFALIKSIIKLAAGVISQHLIATTSWIMMMRFVSEFGSIHVAGYTITLRIIFFALLPSFGMSNAAATLVGQNLGANAPERAEKAVYIASATNTFFLLFLGLAFLLFPEFWMKFFVADSQVIHYGAYCLQVFSVGFIFYGLGMVLLQSINGAGDTVTPLKLNLFVFWLIEIPLAYYLAFQSGHHANGVYYSILVSETVFTIIAAIIFMRGKWKLAKV